MSQIPTAPSGASGSANTHHALIDLHARAGTYGDFDPGVLPGFNPFTLRTALTAVANAPEDEIPTSARLAVLHDLAQNDWPDYENAEKEYRMLAQTVADAHGLDIESLLDDLKMCAQEDVPFSATKNGQRLPHHVTAFIGEDICHIGRVDIAGLDATWIFSEFETDAPFEAVAGWVDPHSWPERGPMLFKQMSLVGGQAPVVIGSLGSDHWHGVFHEEVQLVTEVNTLLHCDYWRDSNNSVGMTYELNLSLDSEINVDRGFLLVNDVGPVRRVKALKIVGFTQPVWDEVATTVCPFWTDWVRSAVEGGSTSKPNPPTTPPHGGDGQTPDPGRLGDLFDAWLEFFGESARAYVELFGDTFSRATSGGYSASDWVDDGSRVWSQLAKDWAQAWSFGMGLVDDVSERGMGATFMPPGDAAEGTRRAATFTASAAATMAPESTLIPLTNLGEGERPTCSDLVSIEAGGRSIPAASVGLAMERLPDGTPGVRISTANTSLIPGLYVGELLGQGGRHLAAAQLYVSGARTSDRS